MSRFEGQRRPKEATQPAAARLSPDDARRIVDGDTDLLIKRAQEVSQGLRDETSRTQIRRLYGEVKRIEMMWRGQGEGEAASRLLLLKPRLAYQVARQQKLKQLRDTLEPVIDQVGRDREKFQHFVEFFEAIVAYAR